MMIFRGAQVATSNHCYYLIAAARSTKDRNMIEISSGVVDVRMERLVCDLIPNRGMSGGLPSEFEKYWR